MLGACSQAPNNGSIRQAVLERLGKAGIPVDNLEVTVTNFESKDGEGEATISLKVKDPGAKPMTMKYKLKQEGSRWVVVGIAGSAASPHGGGMPMPPPGAPNPHGAGGAMPAPEDLPPAGKKK